MLQHTCQSVPIPSHSRPVGTVRNRYSLSGEVLAFLSVISLQDLEQQQLALKNLFDLLSPGGLLVLAEGFTDGFGQLSELRRKLGLPAVEPATINFYSSLNDLLPGLLDAYEEVGRFHLGAYDFLTRVVYPTIAGMENVKHNTVFSEHSAEIARAFNPQCFVELSRMRGFALRKR